MNVDQEKVEQTVLALLYLPSFRDRFRSRSWKVGRIHRREGIIP